LPPFDNSFTDKETDAMTALALDTAMTPDDAAKARFWDRLARKYAARPISDMKAYEKTLERTRAWLTKDQTVLELGCGTGSTAILHAPHVRHITGSDISPEMIAIANEKLAAGGPANADFIAATPEDDRFQAESYDVVLALNFLHLVDDLPATLKRVHGLLTTDGLFITKTPCIAEMGVLVKLALPFMRAVGKAPFVNFFTMAEFGKAVERAGFEVAESGLHAEKGNALFIVARKA
jgi:ubiquinone/menaquinone biosynthesis C-methylase UbiE